MHYGSLPGATIPICRRFPHRMEATSNATATATHSNIRQHTERLLAALTDGLYERETAVNLAFLTTVAGESIFLLGPPGVGKSLIARRLKHAFEDGTSFEYLMSKFSTPDEIFGPVSIKKLKDEDKYERLTDRYLPGANIVFLDEIWKAGPAIQNALLTILNEKIYRNGDLDIAVDIRGIITASNELPPRNQSLEAIWDRFLVRLEIGKIRRFRNFVSMIVDTKDVYADTVPADLKLTQARLDEWTAQVDGVEVPAEVLNTIQLVMVKIEEHNARPNQANNQIKIYDRRWKKIIRLMRTSAYLNGRQRVDLMDCFLMQHCLWNTPEHREVISEMITDAVRQHGYSLAINLGALKKEVRELEADIEQETQIKSTREEDLLQPIKEHFYELEAGNYQFKGRLVDIDEFRGLEVDTWKTTSFYDAEANLINRIKARKGGRENTIEVNFNGQNYTFGLTTIKRERTEIIFKKPHPVMASYWDERIEQLQHYIGEQQQKLTEQVPTELNRLGENLFVDSKWAEVVTANLEEVRQALEGLQLRLEKGQFAYAKLRGV